MWSRLPGEILIPVAGKPTSSHVKPDFRVMYGVARRRSRGVSLGSNPGPGITAIVSVCVLQDGGVTCSRRRNL